MVFNQESIEYQYVAKWFTNIYIDKSSFNLYEFSNYKNRIEEYNKI